MSGCICGEPFWSIYPPRCPVRDAIERYLHSRREDPAFRERLERRLREDAVILRRLRDDEPPPGVASLH